MEFILNKDEIRKCFSFANNAWKFKSQSQKHFGGNKRSRNAFLADQIEGKLAELVFMKFLGEIGISVELDFNHYQGEHNTDNGDFLIPFHEKLIEANVDIKGSSQFAQWLLVENYKFYDIETSNIKSKGFVMICFKEPFPGNKALRENPGIILENEYKGEVRGWAKAEDFYVPGENSFWFEWKQGDRPWNIRVLPKTAPRSRRGLENYLAKSVPGTEKTGKSATLNLKLDATLNYGLPIKWLRTDWGEFIAFVSKTD